MHREFLCNYQVRLELRHYSFLLLIVFEQLFSQTGLIINRSQSIFKQIQLVK